MNPILQIRDLSFKHENITIFENFNYTHGTAHKFLWVGPSGRGKSTLAKIIVSHLQPLAGELIFSQKKIYEPGLGRFYVGPENDLFSWKSLEKQILFLHQRIKYDRLISLEKVYKLASQLEIETLFSKFPTQISTGEMRRFQILRALLINSQFMIFDESFSALDAKLKKRIMPHLLEFWNENKTSVVIISHESDKNFDFEFDHVLDFNKLT